MKVILANALISLATFCHQVMAATTCANFTVSTSIGGNETYTRPAHMTFAVSKGVVCNLGSDCTVPVGGYVTDQRLLNISSPSTDSIFSLITKTTHVPFNSSFVGSVENTTWPITAGTSGYIGFTPLHKCVQGILSGCNGDDLEGLGVEACTPFAANGNGIQGVLAAVSTSAQAAQAMVCNLANTSLASNGNNTNVCVVPTNSSGNSTAGQTQNAGSTASFGFSLLTTALLVAVFAVLEC